jgi:hypothetical protein
MRSLFLFQMAKTPLALFPLLAAAIPSVNASAQVPNPIRTPHPGIAPPSVALLPTLAGKAAPLFAVPDGKWNHGEGCGELVVATMSGDVYVLDVDSMQIRMRTHVDGPRISTATGLPNSTSADPKAFGASHNLESKS